jgi:hypothetical protein
MPVLHGLADVIVHACGRSWLDAGVRLLLFVEFYKGLPASDSH